MVPRFFGAQAAFWTVAKRPLLFAEAAAPKRLPLVADAKYVSLIETLSKKHQFDPATLHTLFSKTEIKPDIIKILDRPPEDLPFYQYRKRFINGALVERGRTYLLDNLTLLQKVEADFGVPKEVICGILGVETKFGQPGLERYRAFDVLNTLFSLYSRREGFYRDELVSFLLLCREEGVDPLSLKSSYAGAMGMPQFMPSSFRKHAIDYDKDGKKDIWTAHPDVCGSVANYLKTFGWEKGGLLTLAAQLTRDTPALRDRLRPLKPMSVTEAKSHGIAFLASGLSSGKQLVSFAFYRPAEEQESLLALFGNFRALLRYNSSTNYAMTVLHLAEQIQGAHVAPSQGPRPSSGEAR